MKLHIHWLLVVTVAVGSCPCLLSSQATAANLPDSKAAEVGLFQAMEQGLVDAKFIARSSAKGRLVLQNKTKDPLTVKLPDAFVGVPALAQFGGGMGGGGMGGGMGGGGGGSQSVGGGGGFGGGRGGGGGGRFNIAPEKIGRVDLPLLCLDHGLKDPIASMPYEIRPIEARVDRPAVIEIVKTFARGGLPRGAAQAAVWNLNNDVSWDELAAKRTGTARNKVRGPYFSRQEMLSAMAIAQEAVRRTAGQKVERPEADSSTSLADLPADEPAISYDPSKD